MFPAGSPARVLLLPGDGIGPEVTAAARASSTGDVTRAVTARLDGLAAAPLKSNSVDI